MTDNGNAAMELYHSRMREVAHDLIALVEYYKRFTEVDHDGFRLSVIVMLNTELEFVYSPTIEEAQQLQARWVEWSDDFIRLLEDQDLSLDYTSDRQRFQELLQKLETAREPLLPTHPAAARS